MGEAEAILPIIKLKGKSNMAPTDVNASRRRRIILYCMDKAAITVQSRDVPTRKITQAKFRLTTNQKKEYAILFKKYAHTEFGQTLMRYLKHLNPPIQESDFTEDIAANMEAWEEGLMSTKCAFEKARSEQDNQESYIIGEIENYPLQPTHLLIVKEKRTDEEGKSTTTNENTPPTPANADN